MASVASVAVELYEFCFFLLPFPHGVWEAVPQSKVSCLMYSLPSTTVHNLFKMCLSEPMELSERSKKYICQSWLCASPCRSFYQSHAKLQESHLYQYLKLLMFSR